MPSIPDVRPIVTQPVVGDVDESNSVAGSAITVNGTVTVDFGVNGPGVILPNGTVTITGNSVAGGALNSGGADITITQTADGYQGTVDGTIDPLTGTEIVAFDYTINSSTGAYTYTQYVPFDHSDTANPDEDILIKLGFTGIDADGDQTPGTVDITISDSGPVATADTVTFTATTPEALDLLGNDTPGMDGGTITNVKIGVTDYPIAASGATTINLTEGTLVLSADGTGTFTSATGNGTVNLSYTLTDGDSDTTLGAAELSCFLSGTMIATPGGDRAVESLQIGDLVAIDDGRSVAVRWIGRQNVHRLFAGPNHEPVCISKGAPGNGVPTSDLTVTADHGMIVDDLVINAGALVNGATIDFVPLAELPDLVTYYHIETAGHNVILANGAPAETFVDVATRSGFDNYQDYLDLCGVDRIIPEMDRPRISSQRLVPDAIKLRFGIANGLMYPSQDIVGQR